jgi:hypothetical protein
MQGRVCYLYAFDVGEEIRTAHVRSLLGVPPSPFELRLDRTFPRGTPLERPLQFELPPLPAQLHGREVRPSMRIYDVGVVAVAFWTDVEFEDLAALCPFHSPTLDGREPLDRAARRLCDDAVRGLGPALLGAGPISDPEAYTVFCVAGLPDAPDLEAWLATHERAVAGLLAETPPERLAVAQVRESMRVRHSFETSDLVVVDWDAALVVDAGGYYEDVCFVLELAWNVLQRPGWRDLLLPPPALRTIRTMRVEATRLADQVTHITKFFGDWYLARVYLGTRDRFHLDGWRTSVERRVAQLDDVYRVLRSEVTDRRLLLLETLIVLLFVLDVAVLLLQ